MREWGRRKEFSHQWVIPSLTRRETEDKSSLTSSLVNRRPGRRICTHDTVAIEPLPRRRAAPPGALQPLATRRLRDADRGFHAARRAGLPRQDRERREEHGQQGRRQPRPRRPHDKTRDAVDEIHESPQSGLASSAGRIVVNDDTDDGNGSNPDNHDRADNANGSDDDRGNDHRDNAGGNGENNRNGNPDPVVLLGIEHGGLRRIVSAR